MVATFNTIKNLFLGVMKIFLDLFNKTPLKKIVEIGIGHKVLPVRNAQVATLFPGTSGELTNEYGYLDKDTPHHGWTGHLDGLWNGGTAVPKVGSRLQGAKLKAWNAEQSTCLLYTTPSPRDATISRMPSSA